MYLAPSKKATASCNHGFIACKDATTPDPIFRNEFGLSEGNFMYCNDIKSRFIHRGVFSNVFASHQSPDTSLNTHFSPFQTQTHNQSSKCGSHSNIIEFSSSHNLQNTIQFIEPISTKDLRIEHLSHPLIQTTKPFINPQSANEFESYGMNMNISKPTTVLISMIFYIFVVFRIAKKWKAASSAIFVNVLLLSTCTKGIFTLFSLSYPI